MDKYGQASASNIPCSEAGTHQIRFSIDMGLIWNSLAQFELTVTSNAPVVNETAVNQTTTALNTAISYNVTNLFANPAGVTAPLTFSATLNDDSILPSWIHFQPLTKIFTIDTSQVRTAVVKVT